jgi:glycosyltransferase involved in cell wall biosynthesis
MAAPKISVIIPAFNEERAIGRVIDEIPNTVSEVIVVDNGSTDATAAIAQLRGAVVVHEPTRGYGQACLRGLSALSDTDIVVFLDGDYSDFPEEMPALYEPIVSGAADLVVGSRVLGQREKGALLPQARFGNWLSTRLIRWLFGVSFTDLGPFRAIDHKALKRLEMCDRDFGWTVEMQVKAARLEMRCTEVPVRYRKRIGISKISGTLSGSVRAGHKILWTIFKYRSYSG